MREKLGAIWYRIVENVRNNYLELFLITSQAMGREPSMGKPYGAGKSTLAIWLAYYAHAYARGYITISGDNFYEDFDDKSEKIEILLDIVRNYLFFDINDLLDALSNTIERIPAVVWDDVQLTAPAVQGAPTSLIEKLNFLTTARPLVSNVIMTAPAISDINKRLRRMITWEIIVPQRGVYEVQYVFKRRNFYNPIEDKSRLIYDVTGYFGPLPKEVQEEYNKRRVEAAKYRGAFIDEVDRGLLKLAKMVAETILEKGISRITGQVISQIMGSFNFKKAYVIRRMFADLGIIDHVGAVNDEKLKEFIEGDV